MEYIVILLVVSLIMLVIGILIGMSIANTRTKYGAMGRLRIDHSEPEEPARMFVELKNVTPDMIASHKFVTFEVINESYISHN